MPDYDFHTLSPADFEDLTRDLLQARDGIIYQSSKTGRDCGVDLRYAWGGKNVVVQCKHYSRSGYDALFRDLWKEKTKLAKLLPVPSQYVVSTSVDLSEVQKEKIVEIFGPISSTRNVLGRDDLNNLLGLYSTVEKKHFKLRLSSTTVLDRVLHNAEATQSDFEVNRVRRTIQRFVRSNAYPQAYEKLSTDRIVIISGPPGVGKTALADVLLYEHLEQGFKAVVARNGFEEARKLYHVNEKVIFYYDDFLGATYLGEDGTPLSRNEDRIITDFRAFVRGNPKTRLILTTREHLFEQAVSGSERLRHAMIDDHKMVVTLSALDDQRRGRILYNHLYFGDLPPAYVREILRDDFYLRIIRHRKFSPRLVEWLSSFNRVRHVEVVNYHDFVRRLLSNPAEIWRHAYEQQISNAARTLLLTLHSLNGPVAISRLHQTFKPLHAGRSQTYGFEARPADFEVALRNLAGTFVVIRGDAVEFLDPSVMDLMNAVLLEHPESALDVIRHAVSMLQIEQCWKLASAPGGARLKSALLSGVTVLHEGLVRTSAAPYVVHREGARFYPAPGLERRVSFTLELVKSIRSPAFADLVEPLVLHLLESWRDDGPDIEEGARLVEMMQSVSWPQATRMRGFAEALRQSLMEAAQRGSSPDEAATLLCLVQSTSSDEDRKRLTAGLKHWFRNNFALHLRELRSTSEYDALRTKLELLQKTLGIYLKNRIDAVRTGRDEFEEHQEAYADDHADEWKERWREEQAEQASLHDLFGSLSGLED